MSSAPAIWHKTIVDILRGIDDAIVFYDDILIWGKYQAEHDAWLRQVIRHFEESGLRHHQEKCLISQPTVSCIGYTASGDGLRPSKDKVEAPAHFGQLRHIIVRLNGKLLPLYLLFIIS